MSDEPVAKRAKFVDKNLKRHVECPICFEIPRDGVVLLCQNGHNICAKCKDQFDTNKIKCPQGECDYNDPPTRNKAIEAIIDDLPGFWFCKYKTSGCKFDGARPKLANHEASCKHRPVPCPAYSCKETVSVNKVVEHCQTMHNVDMAEVTEGTNTFVRALALRGYSIDSPTVCGWKDRVFRTTFGTTFFSCFYLEDGLVYAWLTMLDDGAEASKLICRISLGNVERCRLIALRNVESEKLKGKIFVGNADHSMSFATPVYPIDWTREKIMKDPRCFRVSAWSIGQMLNENSPEGNDGAFDIMFSILQSGA